MTRDLAARWYRFKATAVTSNLRPARTATIRYQLALPRSLGQRSAAAWRSSSVFAGLAIQRWCRAGFDRRDRLQANRGKRGDISGSRQRTFSCGSQAVDYLTNNFV
jgi:hypothetical protein